MTEQTARSMGHEWRDRVMTHPDMILEDRDLMRALMASNDRQMGRNVVDMRGVAMARLEARLDRLEDTHRSVIAAAYENLAGTNQIQRCVLRLLECHDLPAMLDALAGDMAEILRVDHIRLVFEAVEAETAPHPVIAPIGMGFVRDYTSSGPGVPLRQITLRQCEGASPEIYGETACDLRSEGLLVLDLGPGRSTGMLAMGSEDPHQFRPNQGTELLAFLTGAVERMLRAHLE
ncbi:MAG: DUF484 family protein [Pseudomonadota bacterium]